MQCKRISVSILTGMPMHKTRVGPPHDGQRAQLTYEPGATGSPVSSRAQLAPAIDEQTLVVRSLWRRSLARRLPVRERQPGTDGVSANMTDSLLKRFRTNRVQSQPIGQLCPQDLPRSIVQGANVETRASPWHPTPELSLPGVSSGSHYHGVRGARDYGPSALGKRDFHMLRVTLRFHAQVGERNGDRPTEEEPPGIARLVLPNIAASFVKTKEMRSRLVGFTCRMCQTSLLVRTLAVDYDILGS